jgi:deoxyribonucleoside regulator
MTAERALPSPDEHSGSGLTGQVARLFFDRQLTKVEIAGRLGISRFRVARLIEEAVAEGVVRIEFRDAPAQDRTLGRALQARFGIAGCVVAEADGDETAVARLAADVVDGCLGRAEAIGIAWGSTVGRVVRAMPARSDPAIDVVQLAGSSTRLDAGTDPGDLTLVLAERLGAQPHRIHAPAFVESAELRTALMRQPEIAATVNRFASLTVALIGIGAFQTAGGVPSSSLLRSGALDTDDLARLAGLGAVGDLLVHAFGADGRFVAPDITARSIAMSVDQLRQVPNVIAVAAGPAKVAAICGALATGVVDILVTDRATAAAVLAAAGPRTAQRVR